MIKVDEGLNLVRFKLMNTYQQKTTIFNVENEFKKYHQVMKFSGIGIMVIGIIVIILIPQNLEIEFLGPTPIGGLLLLIGFVIFVIHRWTR